MGFQFLAFGNVILRLVTLDCEPQPSAENKVDPSSEKGHLSVGETQSLKDARGKAASPEYNSFGDYSEMVTQFEHCALWRPLLVSRSYYGPDQQLARIPLRCIQDRPPSPSSHPLAQTPSAPGSEPSASEPGKAHSPTQPSSTSSATQRTTPLPSNSTHHHDPPLSLVPRLAHRTLDLARLDPRPRPRQAYPRPRCLEGQRGGFEADSE